MGFVSITDVFKIGIGPSSSHTLGALKSGLFFRKEIENCDLSNAKIEVELCGGFALAGKGHLTDIAVVCGLSGFDVEKDGESFLEVYDKIRAQKYIKIKAYRIPFDYKKDILWNRSFEGLAHPNTIGYKLIKNNKVTVSEEYRSIGGGILENEKIKTEIGAFSDKFAGLADIIKYCKKNGVDFVKFVEKVEKADHGYAKQHIDDEMMKRWNIMKQRIDKGLSAKGTLPGMLHLKRRATKMFKEYVNSIIFACGACCRKK